MHGQVGLAVDMQSGSHLRLSFDHIPYYVAALEVCLEVVPVPQLSSSRPVTVLSNGLLAGSEASVANNITVAASDDGELSLAQMRALGLPFDGFGCSPIVLVGRSDCPSVLLLERRSGVVRASISPFDSSGAEDACCESTSTRLRRLCTSFGDRLSSAAMLVTGPASRHTRFGALVGAIFDCRRLSICAASSSGGLGSRLLQRHGLAAVVVGSDRSVDQLIDRTRGGWVAELLGAGHLAQWDALCVALHDLWSHVLCYNGQSIYWERRQRDDLLRRDVADQLLRELRLGRTEGDLLQADWAPQLESVLWMGPQLGVFEGQQVHRTLSRTVELGFDSSTLGTLVGWLLEQLQRGMLMPQQIGLSRRPSWDEQSELAAASRENAELTTTLMQQLLYADWAAPLRGGLRTASAAMGAEAADLLLWQSLGDRAEAALQPLWCLSSVAPLPLPVRVPSPGGGGLMPPRQFGWRCAERLVSQLAMVNSGLSLSDAGRLLVLYPELTTALYGVHDGWLARHRRLAESLYRRVKPRPWYRGRVLDWVLRALQQDAVDGASRSDLEIWRRRLARDAPSAVRGLWCEIDSGVGERLAS